MCTEKFTMRQGEMCGLRPKHRVMRLRKQEISIGMLFGDVAIGWVLMSRDGSTIKGTPGRAWRLKGEEGCSGKEELWTTVQL